MFSDFVGDFLALAWCKLVQLLHCTKKPKGGKVCVYAGLCCGCTALHRAVVPPTGITDLGFMRVPARFWGFFGGRCLRIARWCVYFRTAARQLWPVATLANTKPSLTGQTLTQSPNAKKPTTLSGGGL
jgi:hypothetical protein